MLVLSSPSGAGKTTIAQKIIESERDIELSISTTTRPRRETEIEGKDYNFVDEATFNNMVNRKEFLEHALVFGYHYGSPKATIDDRLCKGKDILFDIDWQGAQKLKQVSSCDIVTIFLLPPNIETLESRLRKRGQDQEETIRFRMSKAADELSHWAEYNYVLINESLEDTVQSIRSILQGERLKRRRQIDLDKFVDSLTKI